MGDSWNRINDEIEDRRYREETPKARRVLDTVVFYGIAIGLWPLIFAVIVYVRER